MIHGWNLNGFSKGYDYLQFTTHFIRRPIELVLIVGKEREGGGGERGRE